MDKHSPEYQRYQSYLLSPAWAAKRRKKFRQAGKKCQYCGRGKRQGVRLQCHHLTYDRLYKEEMKDLAKACEDCHKIADEIYRMEKARATFMCKKYGDNWADNWTIKEATTEFQTWLQTKND